MHPHSFLQNRKGNTSYLLIGLVFTIIFGLGVIVHGWNADHPAKEPGGGGGHHHKHHKDKEKKGEVTQQAKGQPSK